MSCCSAVKGAAGCSGIIKLILCRMYPWPATHTEAIAITGNNLISFISPSLEAALPRAAFLCFKYSIHSQVNDYLVNPACFHKHCNLSFHLFIISL